MSDLNNAVEDLKIFCGWGSKRVSAQPGCVCKGEEWGHVTWRLRFNKLSMTID